MPTLNRKAKGLELRQILRQLYKISLILIALFCPDQSKKTDGCNRGVKCKKCKINAKREYDLYKIYVRQGTGLMKD